MKKRLKPAQFRECGKLLQLYYRVSGVGCANCSSAQGRLIGEKVFEMSRQT